MIEETKYLKLVENISFNDERVDKLDSLSEKRVYTDIWLKLQIISILYYECEPIPLHWIELSEKIRQSINDIKKTVRLLEELGLAEVTVSNRKYYAFDPEIADTQEFLSMPSQAQSLYFQLGIHADENGYNNKPKAVARMANISEEYLQTLEENNFIVSISNGIKMNDRGERNGK